MLQSQQSTPSPPQKTLPKPNNSPESQWRCTHLPSAHSECTGPHEVCLLLSLSLYVGSIFVLTCSARCSFVPAKWHFPEVGQLLVLSLLFSYFVDSKMGHKALWGVCQWLPCDGRWIKICGNNCVPAWSKSAGHSTVLSRFMLLSWRFVAKM